MGFFNKFKEMFGSRIENSFKVFRKIDEGFFDELEEILITSDVGVNTSSEIMQRLKDTVKRQKINDVEELKDAMRVIMIDLLDSDDEIEATTSSDKRVIIVVGVNGVGKTTSVGKLANFYLSQGKQVICVAADTFRAAAVEQLQMWTERANCDIIRRQEGSDPASVVYDAILAFAAKDADVLICDTAGRLHNKRNLMDELNKINRIVKQRLPDVQHEVLLIIDATTGQNAVIQAEEFKLAAHITGVFLTKLDSTAKGGVVFALNNEHNIPVKFIGTGEKITDIVKFSPDAFVQEII